MSLEFTVEFQRAIYIFVAAFNMTRSAFGTKRVWYARLKVENGRVNKTPPKRRVC
jgi:hypothetical protein